MTANMTSAPKSLLATVCFYVAAYLGFGAACTLTYQWALWLRSGSWIVYDMSLIFSWFGWQRAPSIGIALAQPLIERLWAGFSDCPISIGLGFGAVAVSLLGLVWSLFSSRSVALRNAH